jgi:hypothetical protein
MVMSPASDEELMARQSVLRDQAGQVLAGLGAGLLSRPVGGSDAVGVTGRPLDQLDPVAVGIHHPCCPEVV